MNLNNLEIEDYQDAIANRESQKFIENPLLQKDVWYTEEDLGLKTNEHHQYLTFNFIEFKQNWFKLLAKLFTLLRANSGRAVQTLAKDLTYLRKFSRFLAEQEIDHPDQIKNQTFEIYNYWLRLGKLGERSVALHYVTLATFFDTCSMEGWLDINTYWFQRKRRGIYPENNEIDYLPEDIWNQLEQNLHYLPEPVQRMVLVIRTTGLRIGELLNLPLDCLRKRDEQWRLRFTTEKYNTEDELPITLELAAIIKEQQEYIRKQFNEEYKKLFCSSKSSKGFKPVQKTMYLNTFNRWLNKLAKDCNLCDKNGNLWHFASHQFRRTVATVMTNAGVRDLIIEKYLRHRSPDMQRYYKHLLKQVLGDELEELMKEKKYVDITGKVISSYKPKDPVKEVARRKMYQITTQYGECHRPIITAPCQTVNACWRCEHWRTSNDDLPHLKQDLGRVEEELNFAKRKGMVRQQKGLEGDREKLSICIKGLESSSDKS